MNSDAGMAAMAVAMFEAQQQGQEVLQLGGSTKQLQPTTSSSSEREERRQQQQQQQQMKVVSSIGKPAKCGGAGARRKKDMVGAGGLTSLTRKVRMSRKVRN